MFKRIKESIGLGKKKKVEVFKVFSDVDSLPGYPKSFVWHEEDEDEGAEGAAAPRATSPAGSKKRKERPDNEDIKSSREGYRDETKDEDEHEGTHVFSSLQGKENNKPASFTNNFQKVVNENGKDSFANKKARDVRFESTRAIYNSKEDEDDWGGDAEEKFDGGIDGTSKGSSNGAKGEGVDDETSEEKKQMREYLFSKIRHGHVDVVQTCIDSKRHNVTTARDENGNTAMHVAVQNNHKKIVNLLLKAGCSLNEENHKRMTALDYAELYKFTALTEYLILKGASNGLGRKK